MSTYEGTQMPACSIIIPVYNDAEGLRRCLEALARQSFPIDKAEVIVVDNGSRVSPVEVIAGFGFASLVMESEPGSYAARNAGVGKATGAILVFTDADCMPHEDWLGNLLARFSRGQAVEAVGGEVSLVTSDEPTAAEAYEKVFGFRQSKYISENGFAVTANLAIRRATFDRIGWFSAAVKSGGDRDWGHRLHMAGGRIEYAADAVVYHPARATLRELVRKRRRVQAGRLAVPRLVDRFAGWEPRPDTRYPAGWRMGWALLSTPERFGLSRLGGVHAIGVAFLLVMVGWCERMRLALGGAAVR